MYVFKCTRFIMAYAGRNSSKNDGIVWERDEKLFSTRPSLRPGHPPGARALAPKPELHCASTPRNRRTKRIHITTIFRIQKLNHIHMHVPLYYNIYCVYTVGVLSNLLFRSTIHEQQKSHNNDKCSLMMFRNCYTYSM